MTKTAQLKHILTMLETVQADDTAVLDEIDARYWCAKNGITDFEMYKNEVFRLFLAKGIENHISKFTRSRDLLKLERPDGWYWNSGFNKSDKGFCFSLYKDGAPIFDGYDLPAEELAEFHAIIQAKIWILENEDE